MKVEREYSFDVMRVIAMFMVITIHVSNIYSRSYGVISDWSYLFSLIYNTITRVSVPIFFMISGALLLDKKFNKKKYIERIKRFLIVIIVWDLVYLIWDYFVLGMTYSPLYKLFIEPFRAHLWFLYSIILLYVFQPLLRKILSINKKFNIVLFILWLVFCTLSMFNSTIASFFSLFSNMGYFVVGKYLYDYVKKNDLSKFNIIMIVMMILSFAGSIYLNSFASEKYNMFYNMFLAYRTPYIILASLLFFILIYNLFHDKKVNKYIVILSEVSFGVYLIHGMFLDISHILFNYYGVSSLIGIPLFTVFIGICSVLTVYILRKNKILKKVL